MNIMTLAGIHCRMSSTWRSVIPMPVAGEDPEILTRFLCLADTKRGICHADLQRELGLLQPRVSRLTDRLLDLKWVRIVPRPDGDRRMRLVQTTPKARGAMRSVEDELAHALNVKSTVRPRRKEVAVHPGQMSLHRLLKL
jgi:DNA-binding MarR family transcriptional regulator